MKNNKPNKVIGIEKGSIAEEVGIEIGDILLEINGKPVKDIFDYRYLINDEYVEMVFMGADGEEYSAEIEKDYDEDIGLIFEDGIMDEAKSCSNKCIFCFIDQLPPNMRDTLYFKDDDSRLSFLQGNYVTLTNMSDEDLDRVIYYHLSPINISVHTTDGELRKKMLHNRFADKLFPQMEKLAEAGIEMNLQIVLCKNINDGKILDKSITDLTRFIPHAKSLSIVPAGLTKYRSCLYRIEQFTPEDCRYIINQVESYQKKFKEEFGTAFVFAADEFYIKGNVEIPPSSAYEDFPQIENGVGMWALMRDEFVEALEKVKVTPPPMEISVATGVASIELMRYLMGKIMERFPQIKINVYQIINEFFGEEITVSGLLTGRDIINQLKGKPLGKRLFLPPNLLRAGEESLLDDMTLTDIKEALGVEICTDTHSGEEFVNSILK